MLVASALGGLAASPRTPKQATALFTRLFTDADATAEAYEAHGVSAASPSASLTPQDPMDHSSCSSNLKHCPNIMMLLSDDHGYTDLGKEIDPNVDTPNLDRMVREGVRFTSGYSSAPQCVPSRAGLMSGRDQNRYGLFQNGADAGHGEDTLPPNVKTIAEHVRKRGYVTGMAGKWHLGSNHDNKTNPGGRGFDEYMSGTMGNFYTNVDRSTGDVIPGAPVFDDAGTAKSSHVPNEELDSLKGLPKLAAQYRNRVDATADFAEAFITRHAQSPFFFYWAPYAPHEPMLEDGDHYLSTVSVRRYPFLTDVENDARRRGLAMIKAVDTRVGRLLLQLSRNGLEERTLVLFASDNGAPIKLSYDEATDYNRVGEMSTIPPRGVYTETAYVGSENVPLRGAKQSVWEGGIKVPMLAYWPGSIAPGGKIDEVVSTLDLTATMAHAAGIDDRPETQFHGVSLLSRLLGKSAAIPSRGRGQMQHLYWTGADGDHAVRAGDWKLRRCNKDIYLFNITADPSELVNRAASSPDWVQKLNGVLDNWLSLLPFKPPPCKTIDPAVRKPERECPPAKIDSRFKHPMPYVDGSPSEATCWPTVITDWDADTMGLSRTWHSKPHGVGAEDGKGADR